MIDPRPRTIATSIARRRVALVALGGLLAASSMLFAGGAFADEDVRASAQALFDDAMKLIEQKDFNRACPKLVEVVRLQPNKIGAMLELSRCYVGAGKLASAWARYRAAADAARTAGDERVAEIDAKVAELAPRVPKIVVVVAAATRDLKGLVIKRDDVELAPTLWDTALPIDAGKHTLFVSASGKRDWTKTVEVAEGVPLTVEIPALDDASPKVAATTPPPPALTTPPDGARPSQSRALAFIPLGIGVLGVGVGAVTGAMTLSKTSDIKAQCLNNVCPAKANQGSAVDSAKTLATISDVAFIVGGVGAAVGLTWVFWPRGNGAPVTAVFGPTGISAKGSF